LVLTSAIAAGVRRAEVEKKDRNTFNMRYYEVLRKIAARGARADGN
jgi:hypothetical protein